MLREVSRWPASTPSKPISLARAITVESEVGHGSNFTIRLPRIVEASKAAE